jgi:hypothetical protein
LCSLLMVDASDMVGGQRVPAPAPDQGRRQSSMPPSVQSDRNQTKVEPAPASSDPPEAHEAGGRVTSVTEVDHETGRVLGLQSALLLPGRRSAARWRPMQRQPPSGQVRDQPGCVLPAGP